ncbi:MAG: HipA domain-containing protein [Candidatus Cryptobacteroides sp.]
MNSLSVCPSSLAEGFDTYSPAVVKALFDGIKVSPFVDFDLDDSRSVALYDGSVKRISVSGVQEKFPAIVDQGRLRLSGPGEQSVYILKPAPWDGSLQFRRILPANEHLTMQIASQVYGIATAMNGLCFSVKHNRAIYLTRRFDILPDGRKLQMEDFASVIGSSDSLGDKYYKYNASYEDIAVSIKQNVAAWKVDLERFFELLLFNYIYANGDAHLKNFSLIRQGDELRLAPAYDLINTSLHINGDDFALAGGLSSEINKSEVYCNTGHPCRADFKSFGLHIGLKAVRVERLLDKYSALPPKTTALIGRSFLDDKSKRLYLRIVGERVARFNRKAW